MINVFAIFYRFSGKYSNFPGILKWGRIIFLPFGFNGEFHILELQIESLRERNEFSLVFQLIVSIWLILGSVKKPGNYSAQ